MKGFESQEKPAMERNTATPEIFSATAMSLRTLLKSGDAAERVVKAAERILKKVASDNKDLFERLLKYSNTTGRYS